MIRHAENMMAISTVVKPGCHRNQGKGTCAISEAAFEDGSHPVLHVVDRV
jgi:hypothetical protein